MFNRKKIKALKENLKMVNDQKIQLRNENIIYQKELNALKEEVNTMLSTLINCVDSINNTLKEMNTPRSEDCEL